MVHRGECPKECLQREFEIALLCVYHRWCCVLDTGSAERETTLQEVIFVSDKAIFKPPKAIRCACVHTAAAKSAVRCEVAIESSSAQPSN